MKRAERKTAWVLPEKDATLATWVTPFPTSPRKCYDTLPSGKSSSCLMSPNMGPSHSELVTLTTWVLRAYPSLEANFIHLPLCQRWRQKL